MDFKPANSFADSHGLFIALAGGTNSGKTFSALRVARGIAGTKKIAAIDTEGGRLLHLKKDFDFDVMMMDPPHRPERYADAAKAAEAGGYGAVLIDSFSMEWVGIGGVLDWQAEEYERMGAREAIKLASWIKPKVAHKAMVYSFLQRRIPIIFSLRAEEKAKKEGSNVKSEWGPICNKAFPFEVTVSFMLMQNRQGVIDLSLPHKMEGSHRSMFRDGEQLSEKHGEMLAAWARGEYLGEKPTSGGAYTRPAPTVDPFDEAMDAARRGKDAFGAWWNGAGKDSLPNDSTITKRKAVNPRKAELQAVAERADSGAPMVDDVEDDFPVGEKPATTGTKPGEPDAWADSLADLKRGADGCATPAAYTRWLADHEVEIEQLAGSGRADLIAAWQAQVDATELRLKPAAKAAAE